MVVLNRVINILILLAAITAVVFSYFLFSKREKLVNGWSQMAAAIGTAAKTLDDGGASGTSAARDLPSEKLKHTNYEQLGQVLPKLKDNVSKIVSQRNELAETMQNAASRLSIQGVDAKNLKNTASYKDQERIFLSGVGQFRSNRDHISREYAETFRRLGAEISAADLQNPTKLSSAVNRGNMSVEDTIARKNTYGDYLARISRALGIPAPQISGAAYRAELNKALKSAQTKNNELKTAKNQLAAEKRRTQQLSQQLASHRKTIAARNASILQKDKQIKNLTDILNKDGSIKLPEKLLTPKDPECYKYVKGMVEYIDKDYGFITINIGKRYTFVQHYGIKENHVIFPLEQGKVMTVVRNPDSNSPLFVGKIVVTKVDDNSSICSFIGGKTELVQEGDSVFFTDEDIAKALSGNKANAGK